MTDRYFTYRCASLLTFILLGLCNATVWSQIFFSGQVIDSITGEALGYANISIRGTDIGVVSEKDGSFVMPISPDHYGDTVTFSLVGYDDFAFPVRHLESGKGVVIRLEQRVHQLNELIISGEKSSEKKYGIRNRGLIHFTDGIFKKNDGFEIGQVIRVGKNEAQITSVNLHINSARPDSASFRINFYAFDEDENYPANRIVDEEIIQRHPIREGWLKFDLTGYRVLVKGSVFVAIEFIPEDGDVAQILYEVKLGGTSRSFYRTDGLGRWNSPPHHYCLYATALVDKSVPEDNEDVETAPAFTRTSALTGTPYKIFIRLPKNYDKDVDSKYPVIYHLDANAYFDPIGFSVVKLSKRKKISVEPIVVGVGYANAYIMDSLRNRDYTYPSANPIDSFPISGGGKHFYQFIKTELSPLIDSMYRTDVTDRTLMGHSLGGYFVLYALLRDSVGKPLFHNYVAASPSLSYGDHYIFDGFLQRNVHYTSMNAAKVYLTAGQFEKRDDTADDFAELARIMEKDSLIQMKYKVYKQLEHMGTAVPSYEDGIEFVLKE